MWRWGKRSNFPGIQYLQSQAGRNYFNVHILDTIYWGNIFGRMWHCTDGDQWEPRTAITWHCGPIRERDTGEMEAEWCILLKSNVGKDQPSQGILGAERVGTIYINSYQFQALDVIFIWVYMKEYEILWFSTVLWQCFYLQTASCVKGSL